MRRTLPLGYRQPGQGAKAAGRSGRPRHPHVFLYLKTGRGQCGGDPGLPAELWRRAWLDVLTARPDDMEKIRRGIGFTYPDPAIDKDKTQHIGNVRYGNEPLMYWTACPGMAHAKFVAETLGGVIHPR